MSLLTWSSITDLRDIDTIDAKSTDGPQLIFKHSTTCPISSMAKRRLEQSWSSEIETHYLDLLSYRDISIHIANHYGVRHESPQVLLIHQGQCVYNESHLDISMDSINKATPHHS